MEQKQNQFQIKAEDEVLKGRYTNFMQVSHSPEEFVLDFMFVHPPVGQMNARIITSPGHLKRIIKVLQEQFATYEKSFGNVEVAEEPKEEIGFKPS